MSSSALADGLRHLRGKLAAQQRHEECDEQLLHAFLSRRDECAFAVLVRRHGPMVLHVCRRVLGHQQDAEDAFQATFLTLARSAASLRKKTALASWLHGTAYRTAMKAKQTAARRRRYERQTPPRFSVNPADELSWHEVQMLLDEEIARLPEIYRCVFVLCCLESVSVAETARQLGLKKATVASRLGEARKRLQRRLAQRGVELTAVLAAVALAAQSASALPPVLSSATIQAAIAGEGTAGLVSAHIADLVQNAASAAILSKTKIVLTMTLAVGLLGGASLWLSNYFASPQRHQGQSLPALRVGEQKKDAPRPAKHEAARAIEVQGRVLDPNGKPIRGAKLLFLYNSGKKDTKKVWGESSAEGRFTFVVPRDQLDNRYSETPWQETHVMAVAEGYGFAVARLGKPGANDLTLRLVKDDVPLRGRILDLQGKPVAGVRVHIDGELYTPENGDLTAWLNALKDKKRDPNSVWSTHLTELSSPAFDMLFPTVTTGDDGRFLIKGIGRERVSSLRIEGPTIATQRIHVMTRPSETIRVGDSYLGVASDVVAAPTRPIVGMVRDKDTGKPLPGLTVESKTIPNCNRLGYVRTTTDKDGRYRLVGLPKTAGIEIAVKSNDLPYIPAVKTVPNPLGLESVTIDFTVKRGVWVTGRITEKYTNKPVWAHVEYFCFVDNPNVNELPVTVDPYHSRWPQDAGSYRIPALPGRGVIAVRGNGDHYIMAVGAEKFKEEGGKNPPDFLSTVPFHCAPVNFHTVTEISPKAGDESIVCNIELDPGRSLKGTVLDPDGKPLDGVRVAGVKDMGYWVNIGAEFTVESLQPNKQRLLQFAHDGKKLAGHIVLRGDEKVPLTVRLQPWGTLTGRLVTHVGDPIDGARVACGALGAQTGKDGRFRIEGLSPGLKYNLFITKGFYVRQIAGQEPKDLIVKSRETKDLGDLKIKPVE